MILNSLVCVYCGQKTDRSESLEHIVPELLGAKSTLYPGAVCTKCNHDLGSSVDGKIFTEGMMAAGLVASEAEGKRGVRARINSGKGYIEKTNGGVNVIGMNNWGQIIGVRVQLATIIFQLLITINTKD